jgi:DNA-binding winged helix-turn-helix (wHTH) protein/Tol biopolymer transport system component
MMAAKSFIFRFADVEVREREFALVKSGETLAVEPKAFRVLLLLLRNPGKLIPKQELLDAVWGDAAVTENSLARAVALLRKLLGDEAHSPRFIETVATVGYRWLGPVEAVEDPSSVSAATGLDPPAEPVGAADAGAASAPLKPARRSHQGRLRWWPWAVGAAVIVLLGGAFWRLNRPLPPPRITAYTQITHDGRAKFLAATDGTRLYFTQNSPQTIMQVGVNGGEIAPLPLAVSAVAAMLRDVSPDGSNALVATNEPGNASNPIWIAPILGGSAKRLGDGENAAFSPDGLSVIYSTLQGDIFLSRIDGTESRKLAHMASFADYFSWSPDRKAIRFDSGGLLWEMSSDGSGLHRLLPDWKEPGHQSGRWTYDGRFYLIVLDGSAAESQIWALDERKRLLGTQSTTPIRLTTGPVRWHQLVPSRDGTKIFADGTTPRGELSRVDPRTGVLQPLLGGLSAEFVSFSPDGNSVAYVLYPEGSLWKANRDGGNRVLLADGPDYAFNPRWSPDSKQIVFSTSTADGGHCANYLVSADGGRPRRLVPEDGADMHDPNWSPEGKRVLFGRGDCTTKQGDLRILDVNSGQVTVVPGSSNMWSPRWSPDGRYVVAFFSDSRPGLPLFDFKTQQWSRLPVNGDLEFPSFSRDSRYMYFLRFGRDQGVFRIPVTGGKEERVVDLAQWHITGNFGFSMTLDLTDAPLVMRDTGTDDIYALTLEP